MPRPADASRLAELIASDFYDDRLDLSARGNVTGSAWSRMPEVECVRGLRASGTSDRTVRLFLTFIAAMDRARDATRLWRAGVKLYESHPDFFEPADVSAIPVRKLRELLSVYGVSQRHGPDADAWNRIASSLNSGQGPVSGVIDGGVGDAKELLADLKTRNETGRTRFPMLRGPKIGPMWVRMVASPGGAEIDRIDTIPVAVDVQLRRVTENLGVTNTRGLSLRQSKPVIQSAWHEAVRAAEIGGPARIAGTCAALDPARWFFGKHGCSHCESVGRRVPIGRACNQCQLEFHPRARVG